jgi:hypothetical protein
MTTDDVAKLKLQEQWMYDRFYDYLERGIGPAYMVEEQGRALCAFGALFEWGGSGACEVWFNFIERARAFNIVRIFRRLLPELAERHKITRMQAVVQCGTQLNKRFMEFLGFINETPNGMKNKLHNGQTAYLYSRCF